MTTLKLYTSLLILTLALIVPIIESIFLSVKAESISEIKRACWTNYTKDSTWTIRDTSYRERTTPRDLLDKNGRTIFRRGDKVRISIQLRSKGNRKLAMGCVPDGSQLYLKDSSDQGVVNSYTAGINGWNFGEEYSGKSSVRACVYNREWGEVCTKRLIK